MEGCDIMGMTVPGSALRVIFIFSTNFYRPSVYANVLDTLAIKTDKKIKHPQTSDIMEFVCNLRSKANSQFNV